MKKALTAGVIAVLVLWFGYSLGYHRGVREERQAWEATRTTEVLGTNRHNVRVSYRNPRTGFVVVSGPKTDAVNVPDPRIYRQFKRSSP